MDPLASVLEHARAHCPYYAHLGSGEAVLRRFPVINRAILRANLGEFVTERDDARAALLEAVRNGPRVKGQSAVSEFRFSADIYIEQTSGSSGVPLRIPKTTSERSQLSLAAWRCRMRYDPAIKPQTFLPLFHRALDEPLPVSPFESSPAGIVRFYDWLNARRFRWIHAPPGLIGYHANVLRNIRTERPAPALQFVEVSGSRPEEAVIAAIKSVLGAAVINQYGTRETWAIGYADELNAFTVNRDAVHVELLDADDRAITEPGVEGAVAVTSKVLRLMPVIRYKTGDRGCWVAAEPGRADGACKLQLSPERDINMLRFKGKWISGNILFKDVLHRIDHAIGYGYAEYMQIRKTGPNDWRLILCRCERPAEICEHLRAFLVEYDPRSRLELTVLTDVEGRQLAERKPHLFVNEWEAKQPAT